MHQPSSFTVLRLDKCTCWDFYNNKNRITKINKSKLRQDSRLMSLIWNFDKLLNGQ